jgi:hypothetical protein
LADVEKQEKEWDRKKAEFEQKKKDEKSQKHLEILSKQNKDKDGL